MYLIFVSSLVENKKLALEIASVFDDMEKDYEIIDLVKLDLPIYDSYKEEHFGIPEVVKDLALKMQNTQGYIYVSPEYNYSIPPVQTNAIAWLSRVGDDFRSLFSLKYIQLATHSGSGGQDICNAMRTQFTKLGSFVMPREIIVNYQKSLDKQSLKHILEQFSVCC